MYLRGARPIGSLISIGRNIRKQLLFSCPCRSMDRGPQTGATAACAGNLQPAGPSEIDELAACRAIKINTNMWCVSSPVAGRGPIAHNSLQKSALISDKKLLYQKESSTVMVALRTESWECSAVVNFDTEYPQSAVSVHKVFPASRSRVDLGSQSYRRHATWHQMQLGTIHLRRQAVFGVHTEYDDRPLRSLRRRQRKDPSASISALHRISTFDYHI